MSISAAPTVVVVDDFEPFSTAGYGGSQSLHMVGRDGKGQPCPIEIVLTLADHFSREQRWVRRFPPDLPVHDQWPFAIRVEQPVARGFEVFRRKSLSHSAVRIRVYALHGVQVNARIRLGAEALRPMADFEDLGELAIEFVVHRLDSPLQLPLPGTEPLGNQVLPKYPVVSSGKPNQGGVPFSLLFNFVVETRPDGVDITWCITRQVLSLRFTDINAGRSGFSWYFNPFPDLTKLGEYYDYADLLHIRICGDISVKVTNPLRPDAGYEVSREFRQVMDTYNARYENGFEGKTGAASRLFVDPMAGEIFAQKIEAGRPPSERPQLDRDIAGALFFRLETVDNLSRIPPCGAPFKVANDIAPANFDVWRKGPPSAIEEVSKAAIDIGIGFVPIIGDVVDFTEFSHALATGEDRWGRKVADWEVALMGLAAIPLLGTLFAAVRGGARLTKSMLASLIRKFV